VALVLFPFFAHIKTLHIFPYQAQKTSFAARMLDKKTLKDI